MSDRPRKRMDSCGRMAIAPVTMAPRSSDSYQRVKHDLARATVKGWLTMRGQLQVAASTVMSRLTAARTQSGLFCIVDCAVLLADDPNSHFRILVAHPVYTVGWSRLA